MGEQILYKLSAVIVKNHMYMLAYKKKKKEKRIVGSLNIAWLKDGKLLLISLYLQLYLYTVYL